MDFIISGLPRARFEALFGLTEADLAARGVVRQRVHAHPGSPCRVSLEDAAVGEDVLLLNYEHQPAASPYRASHAIFVREGAAEYQPVPGAVPEVLRRRILSVRAFDAAGMMVAAEVVPGSTLEPVIAASLGDPRTAYLHLHNAGPGCFAARVDRAQGGQRAAYPARP